MKLDGISRALNMLSMKARKNAPTFMTMTGVAGIGVGVYLACKETLEAKPVIDNHCKESEKITTLMKDEYDSEGNELRMHLSDKEVNKMRVDLYLSTGKQLGKIYYPSAIVLTTSIGLILGGHKVLSNRYTASLAAYSTLSNVFAQYRENVVERYGKDIDTELRYGIKKQKAKKNESEESFELTERSTECLNDYSKFFDESSIYWDKDAEYNKEFLLRRERDANEKLKKEGIVFLNDVYESLGLEKTKAGQVVGWIYDKDNTRGDNYIDFGLTNIHSSSTRNFVNGIEKVVLLDFNVDGNVWDLMK